MESIDMCGNDVDTLNSKFTSAIIAAANEAIPKSKNRRRELVPWWTEECSKAVKARKTKRLS